jgi:23S rRNA (uracil1939-C5)-methyltransferase
MRSAGNARHIIRIHSVAFGGRGVGKREDGKVVFAAGALPGETVLVIPTREYKNYILAETREVLVPSPDRIEPLCSLFPSCGGCDWQHIAYGKQVEIKQQILVQQLMHTLPPDDVVIEDPVPSPADFGYRCHAILRCSSDRGFSAGFYQKSTNTIVPLEQCPVLNHRTQSILAAIKDTLGYSPVPGTGSLEIHALDESLARVVMERKPALKELAVFEKIFHETGLTGLSCIHMPPGYEHIWGAESMQYRYQIKGRPVTLATGFGGFIQVNPLVNELMVNHVLDLAEGAENILDLYCGNGNLSIPLASRARKVLGVEKDPDLVRLGRTNAAMNHRTNVTFSAMDSERAVRSLSGKHEGFDTIVLDPPREGARDVVKILAGLMPERIIYVSCDPSTLSRDLAILRGNGFGLKSICLFDMFPQTYHLESVSCLERSRTGFLR